ncbi:hypothetical protein QUA82_21220 [Microcoleus sp. F8-D3]
MGKILLDITNYPADRAISSNRRFNHSIKIKAIGESQLSTCAVIACPIGIAGVFCHASQVWISALG